MRMTLLFIFLCNCLSVFGQVNLDSIDHIVQYHIDQQHFEGTILIADQGQPVYQRSYGLAERSEKRAIENQTIFSIASITKMLTAIIVLQLIEDGKLTLDDHLQGLLPEFKIPNAQQITIHHLLLHISGLPNEKSEIYLNPISPKEYLATVLQEKVINKGFGKFNYNNLDYIILGLIIEQITGKSWEVVIQEKIINKLELNHTGFLKKDQYPSNFAYSYCLNQQGQLVKDPSYYIENFYAAACMYSNAEDLLKVDQALYGDVLLNEASRLLLSKSYPEYNYTGYSVWNYQYPFAESKPLIMERRGGILGANVVLMRLVKHNRTIIILSNNNAFNPDSFGDPQNLREALLIELGRSSDKRVD